MASRPDVIERLVQSLSRLPSVGRKSAQRLAYHVLKDSSENVRELAQALLEVKEKVRACNRCGNYTEAALCAVCINPRRRTEILCVVEKAFDILAFEKSGHYQGLYHVLGGCLSPLDGVGPRQLNIESLFRRIPDEGVRELIVALNTNSEGEATAAYIRAEVGRFQVKVSRLARGIPMGSDLAYVDELTMQRALDARTPLE